MAFSLGLGAKSQILMIYFLSLGLALETSPIDSVFIVLDNSPCHRGIGNLIQDLIPHARVDHG